MGTFFIIAIVGFILFIFVQLTDTSPVKIFTYKYKGVSFMGSPDIMLSPNLSTISIQEKFITIKSSYSEPVKMRVLNRYIHPNYIRYTCMDGHRNQIDVVRSRLNSELLDATVFSYSFATEIYTNNPNLEKDINKADAIINIFNS